MNNSVNKIYLLLKTVFQTALLFALAVMLLVVSCPLKRLLQNDFSAGSSSPLRTNQTNINQATASDYYISNDGCGVKQKAELTKFKTLRQVKISAFTNLSYISNQAGFGLNYLLSRIKDEFVYPISFNTSSLPIYLQHLRLRI